MLYFVDLNVVLVLIDVVFVLTDVKLSPKCNLGFFCESI